MARARAATEDVALLTVPPPQAQVHTEFQPDAKPGSGWNTVKGRLTLHADPELVWQVLTNYESSAAVFSSIQSCSVETREDGRQELSQKCGWRFLAFSGSFDCRLVVQEDTEDRKLTFNLVESSFMRDFEGRWHVQPGAQVLSGAEAVDDEASDRTPSPPPGDGGCVVEHVLSVKPLMAVPAPFSFYTRSIFCKQVEAVLRDLQREVERRQAAQLQAQAEVRVKVQQEAARLN